MRIHRVEWEIEALVFFWLVLVLFSCVFVACGLFDIDALVPSVFSLLGWMMVVRAHQRFGGLR